MCLKMGAGCHWSQVNDYREDCNLQSHPQTSREGRGAAPIVDALINYAYVMEPT